MHDFSFICKHKKESERMIEHVLYFKYELWNGTADTVGNNSHLPWHNHSAGEHSRCIYCLLKSLCASHGEVFATGKKVLSDIKYMKRIYSNEEIVH